MKKRNMIVLITCLILLFILGVLYKNLAISIKDNSVIQNTHNSQRKNDTPKENEPYKNSAILKSQMTDDEEKINLKYDQYIIANGFVGASDNAYYTRNKSLYHLIISTNETTKLAEGIDKIENDKDLLLAYKGSNFKLINQDNYVLYVD